MLVDTGASTHTLAAWIARKTKLPLEKLDEVGADHAGRSIATYRVDHPKIAIDAWGTLGDAPVLAAEVPSQYEELGIGAFLSPQLLAAGDDGAIVLDFVHGEMRAASMDDAMHALGRRGSSLAPNGETACVDDDGPIPGLTFVLPAKVDGHQVDLLLDTGAERTDLLATSVTGRKLERRSVASDEQLYAASGKMSSRIVKGAVVSVGDFSVRTDVALIPGALDPTAPRRRRLDGRPPRLRPRPRPPLHGGPLPLDQRGPSG